MTCTCICHRGAQTCCCTCPDGLDAYVRYMQELSCYGDGTRRTKYRTIVIDPPWTYRDKLGDVPRGASSHYPCMSVAEICALPVGEWADDDAHLYLWTTNAFLVEAHGLAKRWGFQQRTVLTWATTSEVDQVLYRYSTEHVLFCVRGSLSTMRRNQPTHFTGANKGREHSRKPAAFYDMVETMSPGPRLDVFARAVRFGWDAFGDEVSGDGSIVHGPSWEPAVPAEPQPATARQPALMEDE